ncbi:MAG: restriction endonuclease [Bacteroidales bacterium]|nr:restriction endonuclease [Bacteroidales bacterium]
MICSYSRAKYISSKGEDPYGIEMMEEEYVRLVTFEKDREYTNDEKELIQMFDYLSQSDIDSILHEFKFKCLASIIHQQIEMYKTCFYCNSLLHKETLVSKGEQVGILYESWKGDSITDIVYSCNNCGWWVIHRKYCHEGGIFTLDNDKSLYIVGSVMDYNIHDINIPIKLARNYLKKNPKDLANINPFRFELLIKDCFEDLYGNCEIVHMGYRKDRGIDLKIIRNNKKTVLVQVKRRADYSKNEGVDVVRSLNGVLFREGLSEGIIVTTAKGFTKDAISETQVMPKYETYSMKLFSFDNIIDLLNLSEINPYLPWEKFYNRKAFSNMDVGNLICTFQNDSTDYKTILVEDVDMPIVRSKYL